MSAKVRLNHMSLQVRNLDRSAKFYQEVFLLPEIECGATHVTRSTHFCISTSDLDGAIEHLRNLNVAFCDAAGAQGKIHVRADGVRSVYLQDPDGYWIEVNEDF
jgi:lactoylglutathione lyase